MFLEQGSALDNNSLNIWVDSKFFVANNLELGDTLEIIAEGKKEHFVLWVPVTIRNSFMP